MDNVDIVYHLAAKTREEADIEKINTIATQKLFEECIKYHVEKVVFFSTVAVYKPNNVVTITSIKEPSNLYGKTKYEHCKERCRKTEFREAHLFLPQSFQKAADIRSQNKANRAY